MKILFVRPRPSPDTIGLQHVMLVEPLELEVLAALVGPGDIPVILDMALEKQSIDDLLKREQPAVLCVTGYITNVPALIQYCQTAKRLIPRIVTVVGGVHCEVCPEDLNSEIIDFRVIRNATTVFPALLNYLRGKGDLPAGVLRPDEVRLIDKLPPFDFYFPNPDRTLTHRYRHNYFYIFHSKVALLKTSFGCPYSCNFCFCREITCHKYQERPLADVMAEIQLIKEKNIYIVDDDFLAHRTRVESFIEANKSLGLDKQYLLYGRADFIARYPDVIKQFRAVGLRTVIVGIESFFDNELKQYQKNVDVRQNKAALEILNRAQVDCYATMIASPDWGPDEFDQCTRQLIDLGVHYVNLQPFTPLPGTGLAANTEDLLIPYSDYAKWDLAHVTIRPQKMTVAEYYGRMLKLYRKVLFQPRFILRYVRTYSPLMLWKMLKGSFLVGMQYLAKMRESQRNAQNTLYSADAIRPGRQIVQAAADPPARAGLPAVGRDDAK